MNNQLLNPKRYADSLSAVTPMSINGQKFINEATTFIKLNPFTHVVANNMINEAHKVSDVHVQKWAQTQQSFIDENIMSFNIGMICESAKYSSEVFSGFKSVATELLQLSESDIIREIAINKAFENYSMYPEVKGIIQKAKNLALASSGVSAKALGADDKPNLRPVLGLCTQISATDFVLGFDGDIMLIIDQVTNNVRLGKYSDVMALVDTESFALDYEGYTTSLRALQFLTQFYDVDMQAFTFKIQGSDVLWRISDNALFFNGEEKSFEQIAQAVLVKATVSTGIVEADSNELFTAFNILWAVKDALMISDTVSAIPNNDGVVFALCYDNKDLNSKRPYTYTSIVRYGSTGGVLMSVADTFSDFSKQFLNSYALQTVRKIYSEQIKAEEAFNFAIMANNQIANDNIAGLVAEKENLELAKASLPAGSLDEVNAKIMSIEDLIDRNKSIIQ